MSADGAGDAEGVVGELLGGSGKRPATFATGRICEEPGCATRLSVYNSRTRCSVHDFDPSLMNFRCATPPERPAGHAAMHAPITRVPTDRRSAKRPAARMAKRHAA